MADNLGDADDRQILGVDDDVAPGFPHALAARPEKCQSGREVRSRHRMSAQRFDQLRAIHFSRRFSCGDEDLHFAIVREG